MFDNKSSLLPKSSQRHSPTSYSPPVQLVDQLVCENPHPFPTEPPVSRLYKMSLSEEAKRVAAEFDFADDEVRKSVKHFIYQMSTLPSFGGLKNPPSPIEQKTIC